jgi:hypothetical protein
MAAAQWRGMTEEEKVPFQVRSLKLKLEHQERYPNYRYQPAFKPKSAARKHARPASSRSKASKSHTSQCKPSQHVRKIIVPVLTQAAEQERDDVAEQVSAKQSNEEEQRLEPMEVEEVGAGAIPEEVDEVVKEEFQELMLVEPDFPSPSPSSSPSPSPSPEYSTPECDETNAPEPTIVEAEESINFSELFSAEYLRPPATSEACAQESPFVPTSEIPPLDLDATPKVPPVPIDDGNVSSTFAATSFTAC